MRLRRSTPMTDEQSHRISFLEREYRRRKLVLSESGGFEKTRGEFVGTDPEHKLEFACDCGETFDNEEDATAHLRDVS